MKTFITLFLSFTLSTAAFATAPLNCSEESNFQQISKDELNQLISKKSVFVVDVNSADSFKEKHVPSAIHYGANKDKFTSLLPHQKDALIVAYCGGPQCTAWHKAAEAACKAGYTNVKHFKGGLKGWFASK